jgi:hypothetical protein
MLTRIVLNGRDYGARIYSSNTCRIVRLVEGQSVLRHGS